MTPNPRCAWPLRLTQWPWWIKRTSEFWRGTYLATEDAGSSWSMGWLSCTEDTTASTWSGTQAGLLSEAWIHQILAREQEQPKSWCRGHELKTSPEIRAPSTLYIRKMIYIPCSQQPLEDRGRDREGGTRGQRRRQDGRNRSVRLRRYIKGLFTQWR